MARPKVGQKGYKGPVHESVGSVLETFGVKTTKPVKVGKPRDDSKAHAVMSDFRKTGYTLSPYESKARMGASIGMGVGSSAAGIGGAVKRRTKARKAGDTKTVKRMTRRITRRKAR